jgi:hypothetical protein
MKIMIIITKSSLKDLLWNKYYYHHHQRFLRYIENILDND